MNIKNIIKNSVILFLITFVLGIALSSVKVITNDTILATREMALQDGYKKVLSDYNSSKDITNLVATSKIKSKARLLSCLEVYDKDSNKIGYIVLTTITGYGGKIKILSGFDTEGNLTGMVYPEMLSETPGVGMKVTEQKFMDSFVGKDATTVVEVDTITSATISSTAVKNSMIYAAEIVKVAKNMN